MKKLFIELFNQRYITYPLRILGGGGARPARPPLNPPLIYITDVTFLSLLAQSIYEE